jgi:exopolyphosphatase / guanosine-5'-triphosphate,3'-diphosphate pyrophosphatase
MKLAVIDCGTNTFNLIIIELSDDNKYEKLFNTRIPVRLGQDSINDGFIAEVPFMRGIDAISTFKHHIKKYNVQKVLAFATSAIREASNGEQFVKEVNDLFDIEINVIDGNREAELIYYGIKGAVDLDDKVSLIMDIGGGSNEFILASKNRIFWKRSFMIGAARLLEKFPHANPITEEDKNKITAYLGEQLQPLFLAAKDHPPYELVGSSGAFESVVEMINGELGGEPLIPEKTEYLVDLQQNRQVSELVYNSTLEQRRNIKGLVPMRVDMIVISCLMINFILDSFNFNRMRVSTYSLKEGALLDYINKLEKN